MSEKVILVDGKNFGFRHAYAHMGLRTESGFPTGMLHGGLSAVLKMSKMFPGSAIVFCWDGKGTTWRHQTPPYLYKANRKKGGELPPEVKAAFMQFGELARVLHSILKFKYLRIDHLEADDLIGLCSTALSPKREVLIVSTDQDFYQLVSDKVFVFHPKGDVLFTPKKVITEFGIPPTKWLAYRALTGDSSDNLPGAPGLGPVKAKEALALGMKPGAPYGMQTDEVKKKYGVKLEQHWKLINYCWRLSRIATGISDLSGCVDPDLQDIVARKVVDLTSNPYREGYDRECYNKLLQFLSRYELRQLLGERNLWWKIK